MRRAVLAAAAIVCVGTAARAQGKDTALAETLFQEGKALIAAGEYTKACPKLAESQRLDPGTGTLLALALCYEGEGKSATAWAMFVDVAAASLRDKRADREKLAREHANALRDAISHLTIVVPPGVENLPGLEVKRDGVLVGSTTWRMPLPIDPGEHAVTAEAPGKRPWQTSVKIGAKKDAQTVSIPMLEAEAPPPITPPSPPTTSANEDRAEVPPPAESGSSRKKVGLLVSGVGLVSLGVAGIFGYQALSKSNEAKDLCSPSNCTDPEAVSINDDAKSAAMVANIAGVVAIVGLGVGAYLFFTAPASSKAPPKTAQGLRWMW